MKFIAQNRKKTHNHFTIYKLEKTFKALDLSPSQECRFFYSLSEFQEMFTQKAADGKPK